MIERRFSIDNEADAMRATILTRTLLEPYCKASEGMLISTVTSELATNLVRYAYGGFIWFQIDTETRTVCLESSDAGPGINDIGQAMQEGFSSGKGLGAGLPAVQRIMDSMQIENKTEGGLRVRAQCKLKTMPE